MRGLPGEHKKDSLIQAPQACCTLEETKEGNPYGISAAFITSNQVWCSLAMYAQHSHEETIDPELPLFDSRT